MYLFCFACKQPCIIFSSDSEEEVTSDNKVSLTIPVQYDTEIILTRSGFRLMYLMYLKYMYLYIFSLCIKKSFQLFFKRHKLGLLRHWCWGSSQTHSLRFQWHRPRIQHNVKSESKKKKRNLTFLYLICLESPLVFAM